jgi:hypothetical protein
MSLSYIEFTLPLRTVSLANQREHWRSRSRRTKNERQVAYWAFEHPGKPLPYAVTMTRIAPRALDDDNVRGALKAVRDGIAERLGIDDRDPRVAWRYEQRRGKPKEYAVHVRIEEC